MEQFCLNCEKEGFIVLKEIQVSVGREKFPITTEVCENCGAYAIDPEHRAQIDAWGLGKKRNFIEYQPGFSKKVHEALEELANQYAITRVELIRHFLAVYLTTLTELPGFRNLRKKTQENPEYIKLINKKKEVISVPIRYQAFREIELYCAIVGLSPSNVIEEAINFCVYALKFSNEKKNEQAKTQINDFLRKASLAA